MKTILETNSCPGVSSFSDRNQMIIIVDLIRQSLAGADLLIILQNEPGFHLACACNPIPVDVASDRSLSQRSVD